MLDTVKEKIKSLLTDGSVKAVVAPKIANGHVAPALFQDVEDLENLSLGDFESQGDARYPLNKVLVTISRQYPDEVFGLLVRGCDERGLAGLFRLNQLNRDKVVPIGICCPQELAERCQCKKPWPEDAVAGEKCEPVEQKTVADTEALDLVQRFDFWTHQFSKCIKCYGCRDICPMCFCNECSLECEDLVSKGDLPVEIPVFHLTRAMHMADRCVDCGMCDEACPADIPLRMLYKKTAKIMNETFGFTSGINKEETSPLSMLGPAQKAQG